jgi:hypothetical protein
MPQDPPSTASSTRGEQESEARPLLKPWQELALLALLPLLLYAGSLGFGFVDPDDELYFRLNPALHDGAAQGLVDLWKAPYLHDYFPVTQMTIWLDLAVFGRGNLWGARLHALAWFVAGVWAVRALIRRLTGSADLAFAVALIYAVHPVCGHAAMWLSERKNLVCFALLFWSFERYIAAREAGTNRAAALRWAAAWGLSVLALLAKPHAVALPVMLTAYELCLGRGPWWRRAAPVTPFVLSTAVFLFLSLSFAQQRLERYGLGGGLVGTFVNDGPVLVRYLWHTVAPVKLSFFYYQEELPVAAAWGWGAWLLVAALAGGTVWWSRRRALVAFGWLCALAALSPALNFAPQQLTTLTDQYHQWALPFLLLVAGLLVRGGGTKGLGRGQAEVARKWGVWLTASATVYAGLLAWARVPDYASMLTVSLANVKHEPDSALARARYTRALAASEDRELRALTLEAGYKALRCPDADRIQLQERVLCLTEALVFLHTTGRAGEAEAWLEREAPRFERVPLPYPTFVRAHVALRTGRPDEAVKLLAPRVTRRYEAAAARLRTACRDGAKSPDSLPPLVGSAEAGLPAHEQTIYLDFERQWLGVLVQAYLKSGEPERAFDAAAVLLNTSPDQAVARQLWAEVCRRLGISARR